MNKLIALILVFTSQFLIEACTKNYPRDEAIAQIVPGNQQDAIEKIQVFNMDIFAGVPRDPSGFYNTINYEVSIMTAKQSLTRYSGEYDDVVTVRGKGLEIIYLKNREMYRLQRVVISPETILITRWNRYLNAKVGFVRNDLGSALVDNKEKLLYTNNITYLQFQLDNEKVSKIIMGYEQ